MKYICKKRHRATVKKYFPSSKIISIPCDENVLAIKQKIPNGAIFIIISKHLRFTILKLSKKSLRGLPFFPDKDIAIPNKIEKTITCNIFPSTRALKGF
tara:strand:+ start:230 stop:526 length:297 start_codon:yes stop_codon:yes gene_type:complete